MSAVWITSVSLTNTVGVTSTNDGYVPCSDDAFSHQMPVPGVGETTIEWNRAPVFEYV